MGLGIGLEREISIIDDVIKNILVSDREKRFYPSDIAKYTTYQLNEIRISLDALSQQNRFIKKIRNKNISVGDIDEYSFYVSLPNSVLNLINEMYKESEILIKSSFPHFDLSKRQMDVLDLKDYLKENAKSSSEIVKIFKKANKNLTNKKGNIKDFNERTIIQYLKDLSDLNIFFRYDIFSEDNQKNYFAYSLNYNIPESNRETKEIIQFEDFWNTFNQYDQINAIGFHSILFIGKNLPIAYDSLLEENGWKLTKSTNGEKIKKIETQFGEISFSVLSNKHLITGKQNPTHTMEINYSGTLLEKNHSNRNVRKKVFLTDRKLEDFAICVESILFKMRKNKEINFSHDRFRDFRLARLGVNVDYILNSQKKSDELPIFKFNEINYRDFLNDMTVRFYHYTDPIEDEEIGRDDIHADEPNTALSTANFLKKRSQLIQQQRETEIIMDKTHDIDKSLKSLKDIEDKRFSFQNNLNHSIFNDLNFMKESLIKSSQYTISKVNSSLKKSLQAVNSLQISEDILNNELSNLQTLIKYELNDSIQNINNLSISIISLNQTVQSILNSNQELIQNLKENIDSLKETHDLNFELLTQQSQTQKVQATNEKKMLEMIEILHKKIEKKGIFSRFKSLFGK